MSTTRAPSIPQAGTRRMVVPPEQLRDAATTLGFVYANGKRPLDAWAIPPKANVRGTVMPETLIVALYNSYKNHSQETRNRYADAYHLVIPEIRRVMPTVVGQMLASQLRDLDALDRLFSLPGIAGALEVVAAGVVKRIDNYKPSGADYDAAVATRGEPPEPGMGYDPRFTRAQDENLRRRVQNAMADELAALDRIPARLWSHVRQLCMVLSCHPELVSVMEAYWDSARQGDRRVHRLIREAQAETIKFGGKVAGDPDHLWRYPPLILQAVRQLGLGDVYGFPEYAVDIGQVLSRSWVDTALAVVGLTAFIIGLLVVPWLVAAEAGLAAAGVGFTVALTDFGVGTVSAALTYTRQLEQDAAAVGTGFRREKMAERPNFGDSYLAGALALVAGFALARSTRRLAAALRTRLPTDPPQGARPSRAPDPNEGYKLVNHEKLGPQARATTYEPAKPPARPRWAERRPAPGTPPRRAMAVGAEDFVGDPEPAAPPRVEPIGGAVPDENMPVAAAKPKVSPPKKAPAKATGSKGLGSTGAASKGTGSGAASTLGKGTSSPATGTGGGWPGPLPPQPANPADVWKMSPIDRGRLIQDALAQTDYKGWFQPDDITKRRNWPLIDFITNDHSHAVSLKTYDPITKRFQDMTTIEDVLDHVEDLAFNSPSKRVTLDVRMPPGTPPQVMKDLADAVRLKVGRAPGFRVVVKTYP